MCNTSTPLSYLDDDCRQRQASVPVCATITRARLAGKPVNYTGAPLAWGRYGGGGVHASPSPPSIRPRDWRRARCQPGIQHSH